MPEVLQSTVPYSTPLNIISQYNIMTNETKHI